MKLIRRIVFLIIFNLFANIISQQNSSINEITDSESNNIISTINLEHINSPFFVDNDYCLRLILYYNGTLERNIEPKNESYFKEKFISLAKADRIILYDCLNENNQPKNTDSEECSYRSVIDDSDGLENCKDRKSSNNNYCCYIKEQYYIDETKEFNSGCIQVDKNEYDKFKYYVENKNEKIKNINSSFGILECFDKIYTQGIYMFIFLFILFFLF